MMFRFFVVALLFSDNPSILTYDFNFSSTHREIYNEIRDFAFENDLAKENEYFTCYDIKRLLNAWQYKDIWPNSYTAKNFERNMETFCAAQQLNSDFLILCKNWQDEPNYILKKHWEKALLETKKIYNIYTMQQLIISPYTNTIDKRETLHELRKLIGHTAFWNGYIPPPLPLHVLTNIDR